MRRTFIIAACTFIVCVLGLGMAEWVSPTLIVDRKIDWVRTADLPRIEAALRAYREDNGGLPSERIGLRSLVGTHTRTFPQDAWGYSYSYRQIEVSPGYMVYSVGRNGSDEGGAGDDITTWTKKYSCAAYGIGCPPAPAVLLKRALFVLLASSFLVAISSAVVIVSRLRVRPRSA